MQAVLRLKTTVLSGNRVEFTAPELPEGTKVELIVLPDLSVLDEVDKTQGVWDYIQSLPPVQRTPEEWAEVEREFQEERNAWDR